MTELYTPFAFGHTKVEEEPAPPSTAAGRYP